MNKVRLISNIIVFCLIIAVIPVIFLLSEDESYSKSERSVLMSFDDVRNPGKKDGKEQHPFDVFEDYYQDQFPFREEFRSLKAFVSLDVFNKSDNNNVYKEGQWLVERQQSVDEKQVVNALDSFNDIIDVYFSKNNNIYYSIIPDKHYFASQNNGYPAPDYNKVFELASGKLDRAEYIDIVGNLDLSDYYKTDSHWSQDKIVDVAEKLVETMNPDVSFPIEDWKKNTIPGFYGVYHGRYADGRIPSENLVYLTNEATDSMQMHYITSGGAYKSGNIIPKKQKLPMYNVEYFSNVDPYDVFCGGAKELLVIENPMAQNEKELVVFRDSFGSSIAPLLAAGYKKITLIDLRYISPLHIRSLSQFSVDSDVLFLYSIGMLNSGATIQSFANEQIKKDAIAKEQAVGTENRDGVYVYNGYAAQAKEFDENQTGYAAKLMSQLKQKLLADNKVYVSLIPDKNYYIAKIEGDSTDYYEKMTETVKGAIPDAEYIDIFDTLELSSFHKTDIHWNQAKITNTANRLISAMNPEESPLNPDDFKLQALDGFEGSFVKTGKADLPAEELFCLNGPQIGTLKAEVLKNNGKFERIKVYDPARFKNKEPYDFFLGGAQMIVNIENTAATNDKKLVVFRDSFGSGIAPLLAQGYKQVTLVDLRYISPAMLGNFVDFSDSDVLFLWSTDIVGGARILKGF